MGRFSALAGVDGVAGVFTVELLLALSAGTFAAFEPFTDGVALAGNAGVTLGGELPFTESSAGKSSSFSSFNALL